MLKTTFKQSRHSVLGSRLDGDEISFAIEGLQIDIGYTSDFDIVQRQLSFQMDRAGLILKIGMAQIEGLSIELDPEFGTAASLGKFDMNIPHIDPLFEGLNRLFRPQFTLDGMLSSRQALDQGFFLGLGLSIVTRWRRWRLLRAPECDLFHMFS